MAGSVVQTVFNEAAAAATTIASGSFASNVTANNWLWILVNGDAADTTTITKNSGTATIGTVTQQSSSATSGIVDEWTSLTCQVTGTGSLDLLCTFGGSRSNRQILVIEVTGVNAVDTGGGASQPDSGTNPTPTLSITVAAQPAFCLAACVDYQGGTPGVGTGFTSVGTFGATVNFIRVQSKAITSTGSTTGNFVNAGLDINNSAMIVFTESSPPTISAQPTDQTANDGATATFSVTATGGTAPYTYQWQDNSSGSFANVSGATSSSYGPTASYAAQGRQYRCVVTGANSLSVTSNAATLRVAFNTSGTGPRAYPVLGGVSGAGSVESLLLGTASAGSSFEHVASGGLSFAGAATTLQSRNFTFSPSGGMTFAGSATVAEANDYAASASGGLTFGGTASAQLDVGFTFAGSGGFTLAGVASALESNDYVHAAAGGLSFAGAATASESNDYAATSSGGILFGGVATVSLDVGFVVTGSGGISFAGAATAAESNDYAASGSGGILFGGEATVEGPAAPGGASDAGRAFWTRRRSR